MRARVRRCHDDGFTLVELLVVIVILGILSAVVVFAVRGAGDKGERAALATDERTIRTAEEAFCAQKGRYAEMGDATMPGTLVGDKFLSEPSKYHSVELDTTGGSCGKFEIKCSDGTQQMPDCGLTGNPTTSGGNWITKPPADLPVSTPYGNRMVRLGDGRILHLGEKKYLTGGRGFAEAHIYDPASRTWTTTTTPPLGYLDVVAIPGTSTPSCINCGKVLTVSYAGTQTAKYDLFDPATETWTVVTQSPSGCGFGRSLTVLADNTILAAGCAGYDLDAQSRADLFDPTALASPWTALPNMQNQRERPVTVRLADGKVLVVGGGGGGTPTGSTVIGDPLIGFQSEIYDPSTKTWAPAGFAGRRYGDPDTGGDGGILLGDGRRALFMIGDRGEVWDPADGGSWTSVPGECACGNGRAKSILPSGKVLAAGGRLNSDELGSRWLNSASFFDPDLNAWTPAAPIPGPGREDMGAISLEGSTCAGRPDDCGKVLVTGGHDFNTPDSVGKSTLLFSESG